MRRELFLLLAVAGLLTGCVTPSRRAAPAAPALPADALVTQRGVLTVSFGKQFSLNGYLATSAIGGKRLIITENFGGVLADVLVQADGSIHQMRPSSVFKPAWVRNYIASDLVWLAGGVTNDCPGRMAGPDHFIIERRWYKLDLQTVATKPGPQPAEMFDATKAINP